MKDNTWVRPFCFAINNDGYVCCGTHDHCSGMYFKDELKRMKNAIEKTLELYEQKSITDSYIEEEDKRAMEEEFSRFRTTEYNNQLKKEGDLYLIKDMDSGLLKIGRSKDAKKRLRQLQTANGHKLVLLCVIKKKGNIEEKIHEKFSELNTNGEWYKYSEDIINEYISLGGNILIGGDSKEREIADFIDRMYAKYPSKCPVRDTYLGKTLKDKQRIKTLLKTYSMEDIERVIDKEVEVKLGKYRMQNFSTFLNNFPDPNMLFGENTSLNTKENNKELSLFGADYPTSIDDVEKSDIHSYPNPWYEWVYKRCPKLSKDADKRYTDWGDIYTNWTKFVKMCGNPKTLSYACLVLERDGYEKYNKNNGFMWMVRNFLEKNGLYNKNGK